MELVKKNDQKTLVEVYEVIPQVMDRVAHKDKPIAKAAEEVAKLTYENSKGWSACVSLKALKKSMEGKAKPAQKDCALEIVEAFCIKHKVPMAREIEWLVQDIVFLMNDVKASTKTKAKNAMIALA